MPKLRSIAVATALVAVAGLPVAPATHASHSCSLDEESTTLDQICESHGIDLPIVQKIVCLVLKSC